MIEDSEIEMITVSNQKYRISHSWFHNTIFEMASEYLRCLSMNVGLEITRHVYNTRTINHRTNCG
jgi:hypothetical protein